MSRSALTSNDMLLLDEFRLQVHGKRPATSFAVVRALEETRSNLEGTQLVIDRRRHTDTALSPLFLASVPVIRSSVARGTSAITTAVPSLNNGERAIAHSMWQMDAGPRQT